MQSTAMDMREYNRRAGAVLGMGVHGDSHNAFIYMKNILIDSGSGDSMAVL